MLCGHHSVVLLEYTAVNETMNFILQVSPPSAEAPAPHTASSLVQAPVELSADLSALLAWVCTTHTL